MPIIDGIEYIDSPKVSGSMDTALDEINVINVPLSGRKKVGENEYKRITRRDVIQKAKDIAKNIVYADEYLSGKYILDGNKSRQRLFNRTFNKYYDTNPVKDVAEEVIITQPQTGVTFPILNSDHVLWTPPKPKVDNRLPLHLYELYTTKPGEKLDDIHMQTGVSRWDIIREIGGFDALTTTDDSQYVLGDIIVPKGGYQFPIIGKPTYFDPGGANLIEIYTPYEEFIKRELERKKSLPQFREHFYPTYYTDPNTGRRVPIDQKRAKIVLDVDLKKYDPSNYYPETQNTQNQNTQNQNKDKKQHTVVKGDTMWAIAKRYGKTLKELAALNPHIKDRINTIYVGEKINLG